MKHLVIFAHPDSKQSFNRAILQEVINATEEMSAELILRDLYVMKFNPVLCFEELQGANQKITPAEIRHEHQLIDQADLITVIYPLWWMGFPAILKGYLDRVLSHGFAYKTENGVSVGLLHGKKMQQFVTIGNDLEKYHSAGFDRSLRDCLVEGLFNFCGISDIKHCFFGGVHAVNNKERQAMLDQVKSITKQNLAALNSSESIQSAVKNKEESSE